ncbi:MAG: cbb3-type cytochrome oxidase assembly protein, partial [Nitrosomonadales bacterium]|nr:cbb3-type cytochrome oxidase assembly protein [Nitrosomonadales bacterium]MBT4183286.1 cbb3-type cytochrome oxidase assembly protein [Nitrosomonadales bacterium]MBT5573316.1 cbb3-type cytochrome oxidase assembly protein [Nitrosomonadales bacterium]MBT6603375.1 cbb3-type cytochrome oxidase assembly protein [Nitrosomonadales bacterium]MBT7407869.1 cbb3-type cytochrome oxidase assembly protein [Nitrosomonadales bacterium]
ISIILNFAVLIFLRWAIFSNQYEKLDKEARRILE